MKNLKKLKVQNVKLKTYSSKFKTLSFFAFDFELLFLVFRFSF